MGSEFSENPHAAARAAEWGSAPASDQSLAPWFPWLSEQGNLCGEQEAASREQGPDAAAREAISEP